MKQVTKFDLENRLVKFAVSIMLLAESIPKTKSGIELGGQIIRSASSASLNYGEAQGAESRRDFIHKLKIVLKELRETNVNLKMIDGMNLSPEATEIKTLLEETNELISIFVKSIQTATKNDTQEKETQIKRR